MSNLETRIKKIMDELDELNDLKEKLEEIKIGWCPKQDGIYWCWNSIADVKDYNYIGDQEDRMRFESGNMFKTVEDCENDLERTLVMRDLRKFAISDPKIINDDRKEKYIIKYSDLIGEVFAGLPMSAHLHAPLYFESIAMAEAAIEHTGELRIKRYYFNVID